MEITAAVLRAADGEYAIEQVELAEAASLDGRVVKPVLVPPGA